MGIFVYILFNLTDRVCLLLICFFFLNLLVNAIRDAHLFVDHCFVGSLGFGFRLQISSTNLMHGDNALWL